MALPLAYTEHRPTRDLEAWVGCFWQITGTLVPGASLDHRVLPDGCADVIFDLEGARRGAQITAEVVGPMSCAQVFGFAGTIDLMGIRLRPGAIAAFSGTRAAELLDSTVSLPQLSLFLHVSADELAEIPQASVRIRRLVEACRERIATIKPPDAVVREALSRWSRAEGELPTVSVLTRDLGLSERALERRFVAQVGLTPVFFRRLTRFRHVLRLHATGLRDWAALAAAAGFSDQSHLVRDYRALTGLTPTEWAATQAGPAGFVQDGSITAL